MGTESTGRPGTRRTLSNGPYRPLNVGLTGTQDCPVAPSISPLPHTAPDPPCAIVRPVGATVTLGAPAVAVEPGGEASPRHPRPEHRIGGRRVLVRCRRRRRGVDDDRAGHAVAVPGCRVRRGPSSAHRAPARPPSGQLPFGVRVRSREDPTGSAVEEGIVDVGSFQDPFAELVPRTSRGSRGANHDLAVDNRGNTRLSAEIEATDADRLLRFDVNPPAVVVEPGTAAFAKSGSAPPRGSGAASRRPGRSSCSSGPTAARPSSSTARSSRSRCCRRGS